MSLTDNSVAGHVRLDDDAPLNDEPEMVSCDCGEYAELVWSCETPGCRAICRECAVDVDGLMFCAECAEHEKETQE
jgi:hypothetical protein